MVRLYLFLFFVLFTPFSSWSATYYVSTTGSDTTGTGSSGNPWRQPQKCVSTGTPLVAGDTCIIRDGTYTDHDNDGIVLRIRADQGSAGTSTSPITIKSENPLGAKISIVSVSGGTTSNHGIRISHPYYIIDGFEIDGTDGTHAEAYNGITLASGANGTIIRNNKIHHIGRSSCSLASANVVSVAISLASSINDLLIEKNHIYSIGRLRNGESGCTTDDYQRDHGIYGQNGNNHTIRRNVMYDTNRGYPIHYYISTGGTTDNLRIENNTICGAAPAGAGGSATGAPIGQIRLATSVTNSFIRNNISCGVSGTNHGLMNGVPNPGTGAHSNVQVSYNLSDGLMNVQGSAYNMTFSNNTQSSSSLNLTNQGSNDLTLTSTSAAINAGTDVGLAYNGSAPDIGAFETFVFASCEVPTSAASTIQITFTSNANLLGTILTTFTARRNGSSNALTGAASKIGDNIVSLPLTTTYVGGDTADISWSSGGLTDAAAIGGSLNQPFVQTLTNQSCTNNAGGSPSFTLTQATYRFHGVFGLEASPDVRSSEGLSSYSVVAGGSFRIRYSVTCGGANCDSTGFYLYYATGGGYSIIPDTFGAGNIAFCGTTYSDPLIPSNGSATTNQLSTSGTFIPGGVIFSSNAIPTINGLNNGYKTELEYCVKFDTDATGSYTFRLYKQTGVALDTYTVTPSVTVISPQSSGSF